MVRKFFRVTDFKQLSLTLVVDSDSKIKPKSLRDEGGTKSVKSN